MDLGIYAVLLEEVLVFLLLENPIYFFLIFSIFIFYLDAMLPNGLKIVVVIIFLQVFLVDFIIIIDELENFRILLQSFPAFK